jgi:hypothetical protein
MRAYSDFAGSITSQGMPAPASSSSSPFTVCDFPAPVAPHTNTWRLSVARDTPKVPAGSRLASSTTPSRSSPAVSGVMSKVLGATSRTPGSSLDGGRAIAASSSPVAWKGEAPSGPASKELPSAFSTGTTSFPGRSR